MTSTSEVGFDLNAEQQRKVDAYDNFKKLFEQQSEEFQNLMKAIKTPDVTTKIQLPQFNPDRYVDAHAWIATASLCVGDEPLQGASLIMALSQALKGQAALWLAEVSFPGMAWADFKTLFITRFAFSETLPAFMINMTQGKPNESESLAAYAGRLVTSVMAKWKDQTIEQIAVASVLAHVAQFEPEIQRMAYTTNIVSRNQMHQELKALMFIRKRPFVRKYDELSLKRTKFDNDTKCYNCGKIGHKAATCRMPKDECSRQYSSMNSNAGNNLKNKTVKCFRCGEEGHISTKCPIEKNTTISKQPITQRRVNWCDVKMPMSMLEHFGMYMAFSFDSGAECSLIKESVSGKFRGKRLNSVVNMVGIGQCTVNSTLQILTTVEIQDVVLEVLFHVLPDLCLQPNILIGREILNQGISINMTTDKLIICKSKIVDCCHEKVKPFSLDYCSTDIFGEDRLKLLSLLNKFKTNFIQDTPQAAALVEPMQIRLKDPNKTVYRRPYRLSTAEQLIVRNKINELLAAKVIRASSSPFASPILLIKKKDGTDRMCIDYRELNDNTIPDRFPLPLISEQIDRLHGCYYFSALDLASGYHQIPMHPDSIEKPHL